MGEKLTAAITVKLSERQLRALHLRAEQKGTVASEYMRGLLIGDLRAAWQDYQALDAIFTTGGLSAQEIFE